MEPAAGYQTGALSLGFIEGYNTMDAIAGLAFGIVVIDIIRSMGVTDDSDVAKDVLSSGLLTSIPMIVIYVTTILMGTQSRGLFEASENGGIALAQISGHYLGRAGSLVLAVTITCACLKTAIGLVTSCSDAFSRMFPKGLSYRAWAVIFTVLSFLISNFGLSKIISYSLPLLLFLYPLAITLILLALFGNLFHHDRAVYVSVTAFTCIAALFDLCQGAARESENRPSSGRRGRPCGEDSPLLRHQPGLGSPRLCGSCSGADHSLCEKAEGRLMLTYKTCRSFPLRHVLRFVSAQTGCCKARRRSRSSPAAPRGLPCSTMWPSRMTRIISASRMVDSRWATIKLVRPSIIGAKAF